MHNASPMASAAVVLAVGTRLRGQASSETWQSSATSAACARRRGRVSGDGDDARADAADRFEQPEHFLRFAAVRNRQQNIVGLDDAEVAMGRFGRMHEERGRARAGQRCGNFPADDARFAHAGDDDASLALVQHPDGSIEVLVQPVDERRDSRGFGLQHLARERTVGRSRYTRAINERGLTLILVCTPDSRVAASMRMQAAQRAAPRAPVAAHSVASLFARAGLSCTSTNSPSTPAATAAAASGSMYSACPLVTPSPPPGNCRLWVAS